MTAVIYARYSSDSQREASIEGQLRDCKDCFGSDSLYYWTYCFEERHIEEFCANGND